MGRSVRNTIRITAKIIGWTMAILIFLLLLITLLIQLPFVQQRIVQRAVSFLEQKTGTEVSLDRVYLKFPKKVALEGFYIEDQKQDTLVYLGALTVDTDLFALIDQKIELNSIKLADATAQISRNRDSVFNFDFIAEAFASAPPDTAASTGSDWDFSIDGITLSDVRFVYRDEVEKTYIDFASGKFDVEIGAFDLEKTRIGLDKVELADASATILFEKTEKAEAPAGDEPPSDSTAYDISFGTIELANIKMDYKDENSATEMDLDLGNATVRADRFSLEKQRIALDRFLLHDTFFAYRQFRTAATGEEAPPEEPGDSIRDSVRDSPEEKPRMESWQLSLNELDLAHNTIQYDDFNEVALPEGFDQNHFRFSDLSVEGKDLVWMENHWNANILHLSVREEKGFSIRSFAAKMSVTDKNAEIADFSLETNRSEITLTASSTYPSLQQASSLAPETTISAKINGSYISLTDVTYIMPDLLEGIPVTPPQGSGIFVDLSLHGSVDSLEIEQFLVRLLENTRVKINGFVSGLPQPMDARFQLNIDEIATSAEDIRNMLADTLLPQSLNIPNRISLSGTLSGSTTAPRLNTLLQTSLGNADINMWAKLDSTSVEAYEGTLVLDQFDLGSLLRQPDMGTFTFRVSVDGKGTTPENIDTKIAAVVKQFEYKDYRYRDLVIGGRIKGTQFDGNISMDDPNLTFNLDGDLDYGDQDTVQYHFAFELKNADFKALNLTDRPLKSRFTLNVDLDNADPQNLAGTLSIRDFAVYNGKELYKVDSLLLASVRDSAKSKLTIDSDILSGRFEGSFDLFSIPKVMEQFFNSYYTLHDTTYEDLEHQYFDFTLDIRNTSLLTEIFLPELTRFDPQEIRGKFDSEKRQLEISFNMNTIQYGSFGIENVAFDVSSDEQKINYGLTAKNLSLSTYNIPAFEFSGEVARDSIDTRLIIYDSTETEKYVIGGIFQSIENNYMLRLSSDELVLNYEDWEVPPDNYLQFGPSGFRSNEMVLSRGSEKVLLQASDTSVIVTFSAFDIRHLTHIIASEEDFISGILNGALTFHKSAAGTLVESDLDIGRLALQDKTLGNIALTILQQSPQEFAVDMQLKREGTNLSVHGSYVTGENPRMDATVRISALDLASVEPWLFGAAKGMSGNLTGNLSIAGTPDNPGITGNLTFKNAILTPTYINSQLKLMNETIAFTEDGIVFQDLELLDENNNEMLISGTVKTDDYTSYTFDLRLIANRFLILNTTEEDNDLFYGTVRLNTDTKIGGTLSQPVVDMEVSLDEGSEFTYIVPESGEGDPERSDLVTFVDKDIAKDPFLASVEKESEERAMPGATVTGIVISANIDLNDEVTFNIVIDPQTGDQLSVRGNANLAYHMNPTGDMNLTGRYELTEGQYNLSFRNIAKREFNIQEGSSITWSGDPLNAEMNITAVYRVETSPIDLVANQLAGATGQLDQYRERLPFLVNLHISGRLLAPEIRFSLDMPPESQNAFNGSIYAILQDINTRESDLNKQVFALLILKRFISDDPFESQGSSTVEATARRSVSRLLSEQLNRLSSNIEGVELEFDIESYEEYSEGGAEGRTDLELGVSKSLFNERLTVKLAGNVALEGPQTEQTTVGDYIGDIAIEYKLTEDGRFIVTGFRNSDYNMIDGELTETGVGIIYVKDYNTFRELFKANEERR